MGFQCGIVGLPNVGKSTLFNALTEATIAAENYPFCTIDPNVGIVSVPDVRLDQLARIAQSKKVIPTVMEFVDIAGLVAGASKGEGLGNQFLAHIRETDAVVQVVRCFEDEDITHVTGVIDPLADIEVIHTELALADLDTVEKALQKVLKASKTGNKGILAQKEQLQCLIQHLDSGAPIRTFSMTKEQRLAIRDLHLLTAKPTMYVANVDEKGFQNNAYLDQVRTLAKQEGTVVVPVCARIEGEMVELENNERQMFLEDMGLTETGLERVVQAGYQLLGLQTYFTAGPKEARAWTIPIGVNAPRAASVIHTDFEKGFIRAEVIAYSDYLAYQGEHGAREAGKWRLEGKDYVVQDGDVVHFRCNT